MVHHKFVDGFGHKEKVFCPACGHTVYEGLPLH
jgi:hypothetical protein